MILMMFHLLVLTIWKHGIKAPPFFFQVVFLSSWLDSTHIDKIWIDKFETGDFKIALICLRTLIAVCGAIAVEIG